MLIAKNTGKWPFTFRQIEENKSITIHSYNIEENVDSKEDWKVAFYLQNFPTTRKNQEFRFSKRTKI
jgi:hypothetical protein